MKKLIPPFILCLALVLGFVVPDLIKPSAQQDTTLDLDQYCMLSSTACLQEGVSVTLEHDIARPLVPSSIQVKWPQHSSNILQLSLRGLEMEMGAPKYTLKQQAEGVFVGTILLPVCTQDAMTWVGTLSDGSKSVAVAIRMER